MSDLIPQVIQRIADLPTGAIIIDGATSAAQAVEFYEQTKGQVAGEVYVFTAVTQVGGKPWTMYAVTPK